MIKKLLIVVSTSIMLVGCITNDISGYSKDIMKDKTKSMLFKASNGVNLPYRLYVNASGKSPLVIFLHGAGERGYDNEAQLSYGINQIAQYSEYTRTPAIIVAPQCPLSGYWKTEEIMDALHELVQYSMSQALVDTRRVYITGFSMGAESTFIYGMKYPEDVTTLVPLCGGPLANTEYGYDEVPVELGNKNVWAFNYLDDTVIDNTFSKFVVGTLWAQGDRKKIFYTEELSGGHTAKMYGSRKLLDWMFNTK